ncbi:hypothetical protein AAKU52_000005 [Pedobacter sp. CG_S7]|uniref:toxin-antitoxin system protein n=1 Tax=Pedobacter sp. CG_S7 TaxID=3143930 RepID=UPI003392085B
MNATIEKKLTSIRLQQDLYLYIKNKAEKSNRSVNNYIETLLLEGSGFLEPNNKTISAMHDVKNKTKGLDTVNGVEELDKYLSNLRDEL